MIKFDHLRIPVTDLARSRDWYVRTLGLKVEFEVPDRQTVALQDTDGRSRRREPVDRLRRELRDTRMRR